MQRFSLRCLPQDITYAATATQSIVDSGYNTCQQSVAGSFLPALFSFKSIDLQNKIILRV